jgi:hypothetical protein
MSLPRDVRHGVRIGRAEFTRSVRGYLRDTRRVLGIAVLLLVVGGNLLFVLPGVYLLGRRVRSASAIPFLDLLALSLPVGLLLVALLRTLERIGGAEAETLLLTTVHPRAVVVGLITAEIARLALWFGLPIALVAGVFAFGLGAPTLVLTAGLVLLPLVGSTAVWGYALGLGVLRVIQGLPTLRRALKFGGIAVLVSVVVLSQFAGQYLVSEGSSVRAVLSSIRFEPLTAYVALAFVGTPLAGPIDPRGLAVLGGCLALIPLGLAVSERQASSLWFTDGVVRHAADSESPDRSGETGRFAPPRPFSWRKSGRIAWGLLVRTARKPQRLVHLFVIVFFVGPFGGALLESSGDGLLVLLGGVGVVLGVYVSGAAFGLNPIGDDRAQLPLVLLTRTDAATYLRGRIGAGLAVGLPLAVLAPVGALATSSFPFAGVAFAVAGVGWCVAAALFALGLGCAYPIYEEREMWGVETVAPSMLVVMTYSFVVVFGTAIGLVVLWFLFAGDLTATGLLLAGVGLYLLVTVCIPAASYLYAVRRYRRYTVD